jgi:uncharacterized cupredoxin-like copper-binding protein
VSLFTAGSAVLLAALLPGSSTATSSAALTVRVDARDFSFALPRRSVPVGSSVRFVVSNRGNTIHDFLVKGRRTRKLRPGQTQTLTIAFTHKRSYRFLCSVSGHARLGMRGTFAVGTRPSPSPSPPPPVDTSDFAALTRVGTFEQPVLVTAPPGDTQRIFVVEQAGTVRIVRDGELLPTPFLDIRDKVKLVVPELASFGVGDVFRLEPKAAS